MVILTNRSSATASFMLATGIEQNIPTTGNGTVRDVPPGLSLWLAVPTVPLSQAVQSVVVEQAKTIAANAEPPADLKNPEPT